MSFYFFHRAAPAGLAVQELDGPAATGGPGPRAAGATAACFTLNAESRGSLTRAFGLLIRELRQAAGMSQEQLAELAGLHRTYVGCVERGEKTVTIETAGRLADALDLSLAGLFTQLEQAEQPGRACLERPALLDAAEPWLN